MKILILLLPPVLVQSQDYSKNHFTRDGVIYVTKDVDFPKYFQPVDRVYQCHGDQFGIITDTSYKDLQYTITIDNVKTVVEDGYRELTTHLMFRYMVACVDRHWVQCPCGRRFAIVQPQKKTDGKVR